MIMYTHFNFIMEGNDEGSTSATDRDITPSTSSPCEPRDQCPSSLLAQPANSTPQSSSEILDIGKLLELGVDLKKLSREHISGGFRVVSRVQRNPPFCQDVKVFCFVFLYNGFINSLAPLERARERELPLLFKLGLLNHRKWACFYTESGHGHPNFPGAPDVGTTLSQILNPSLVNDVNGERCER